MDLSPLHKLVVAQITKIFPQLFQIPKAHRCAHRGLLLVPILSQINQIHTLTLFL